jgi:hypothetical protein
MDSSTNTFSSDSFKHSPIGQGALIPFSSESQGTQGFLNELKISLSENQIDLGDPLEQWYWKIG